jgi:ketosteroid isomerase-like protein
VSREDVEVVRRVFEAQDSRDVYGLFHPDIEWEDASGLWSGDWGEPHTADELRESWSRWFEVFEAVHFEAERITDLGGALLVDVHASGTSRMAGVPVDQRIHMVWTVRDGKVARVRAFRERAEALEAAGLSE